MSKQSGITLEFKDTLTIAGGGDESVMVTGNAIQVKIRDGVTTQANVITVLDAKAEVAPLVSYTTVDVIGVTAMSATSLAADKSLSRLSWQPFNTYCAISEADKVSATGACNFTLGSYDLGASCLGYGTPVGLVTAPDDEVRYYDMLNNKCYRSYESAASTWTFEEYKATGAVTLSWEPFTVSGASSITGYKVYRRLGDGDGWDSGSVIDHPFDYSVLSTSAR